jgi:hypothetical protein
MKTKCVCRVLVLLFCATAPWAQAESSISQAIANVNSDTQKPGGVERALKTISASTHVPIAILKKEKARTALSYGDLYVAHAIARAAGRTFDQIVALKMHGQTWDKIADANNVSFGATKRKQEWATRPLPFPASLSIQSDNRSEESMHPYNHGH